MTELMGRITAATHEIKVVLDDFRRHRRWGTIAFVLLVFLYANKVEISKKSLNYALRNHDRKELEEKMKTYKKLEQIEEIYGEKVYS